MIRVIAAVELAPGALEACSGEFRKSSDDIRAEKGGIGFAIDSQTEPAFVERACAGWK